MIVSRRCDRPMARRKRLLPCDKNCRDCMASIERDDLGNESHGLSEPDSIDYHLMFRNMQIRRRHGDLKY